MVGAASKQPGGCRSGSEGRLRPEVAIPSSPEPLGTFARDLVTASCEVIAGGAAARGGLDGSVSAALAAIPNVDNQRAASG